MLSNSPITPKALCWKSELTHTKNVIGILLCEISFDKIRHGVAERTSLRFPGVVILGTSG